MPRPRKVSHIETHKRIIIIVEGDKTEKIYFEDLKKDYGFIGKQVSISIITSNKKSHPKHLLSKAISTIQHEELKLNKGDQIWIVFDNDNREIQEIISKAKNKNIKIAYSHICFEYWYLLHYNLTSKQSTCCNELIKNLSKEIKNYNKSHHLYSELQSRTETAISNATKLISQHRRAEPEISKFQMRPVTTVHELVNALRELRNTTNKR